MFKDKFIDWLNKEASGTEILVLFVIIFFVAMWLSGCSNFLYEVVLGDIYKATVEGIPRIETVEFTK